MLGGTGFIGSHLVRHLTEVGIPTVGVGRRAAPVDVPGARTVLADLLSVDVDDLLATERPQVVFDLVGSPTVPISLGHPAEDLVANTVTTVATLEAARKLADPPLYVFVSSAAVYGSAEQVPMTESHPRRPLSPYGVAKLASEHYVDLYARLHRMPALIARPFSVYGPGQRKLVVYDLVSRLISGERPLPVHGSAEVTRDFVWVGDLAAALVQLARAAPAQGEAYNVASGVETSLRSLVDQLIEIAAPGAEASFDGDARSGDPVRWVGDLRRAAALGAICDTPLRVGLEATAHWVRTETGAGAR